MDKVLDELFELQKELERAKLPMSKAGIAERMLPLLIELAARQTTELKRLEGLACRE